MLQASDTQSLVKFDFPYMKQPKSTFHTSSSFAWYLYETEFSKSNKARVLRRVYEGSHTNFKQAPMGHRLVPIGFPLLTR